MEDRWTAIRWAIGSAQADDCVVIAGRGHKDFVEWTFDGETVRVCFHAIPNFMVHVSCRNGGSTGPAPQEKCSNLIVGQGYRLLRASFTMQGWFDDRVEARNALAKVAKLWQISGFDHAELPWMDVGDREGRMFNKALF